MGEGAERALIMAQLFGVSSFVAETEPGKLIAFIACIAWCAIACLRIPR